MNHTVTKKLEDLAHYGTAYELALVNTTTGEKLLIAYTRKTKPGALKALQRNGRIDRIHKVTGGIPLYWTKRGAPKHVICDDDAGTWSIRFTGRTQRDAIKEGELQELPLTPQTA